MSIKRNDIKAILPDIEDDAMKKLLNLIHEEADSLKDELDTAKNDLEKAQNDLKAANTAREKAEADFESYKTEQGKKETKANKEAAYKALLKDAGVADKYISLILKGTDLDGHELGDDGKFKEAGKLLEGIKTEHADFIAQKKSSGADVDNPPSNGDTKNLGEMSMADYIAARKK